MNDNLPSPSETPPVPRRMPVLPEGGRVPPIFNVPPGVKSLILLLIAIHVAQHIMPAPTNIAFENLFGYYPYRYWRLLHGQWAGPLYFAVVTPLTYMFLHANWMHLAINVMSLAAFGSGVERIAGARYMVWLFLICGFSGAFVEFAIDPTSQAIIIGASAGISGLFAVAFLSVVRQHNPSRRRLVLMVCLMLIVMAATGIGGIGGMAIAWMSHIGGFLAGVVADAAFNRTQGANRIRDLWWLAALIALPLLVIVTNISRYF